MKKIIVVCALSLASWLPPSSADAGDYVIYLHGRSMQGWPGNALVWAPFGWQHLTLTYNGSERLINWTTQNQVKSALRTYCRNSNQCVVVTYSAGMNRLLLALDDLAKEGTPADRILWIEAAASAAGGTETAEYTTKWWKRFMAKVLGLNAKIDKDLTPSRMRGTFGYIQNRAPVSVYHSAGKKNICRKFLFGAVKICGNDKMPGEKGDGAVPVHSACGYAARATRHSCCDSASKYTNRQAAQCALHNHNHSGMFGVGVVTATVRFGGVSSYSSDDMLSSSSLPDGDEAWDDVDAESEGPTIAGVLNVTPPDSDGDGRYDTCIACDPAGCGHCEEFSIAEAAYSSTCNRLTCTPTLETKTTQTSIRETKEMWGEGNRIRVVRRDGTTRYYYLRTGVTVSGGGVVNSCSSVRFCKLGVDVSVSSGNQIAIRSRRDGSYKYLTFSGATLLSSGEVLENVERLEFFGNQMIWGTTVGSRFGSNHEYLRFYVVDNDDMAL
ncbi:MAG: hypothetical protein MJE77_14350 [Proteobacteria bacterium]|nr:hypothetical protein [Pseudomonadota bacterium]